MFASFAIALPFADPLRPKIKLQKRQNANGQCGEKNRNEMVKTTTRMERIRDGDGKCRKENRRDVNEKITRTILWVNNHHLAFIINHFVVSSLTSLAAPHFFRLHLAISRICSCVIFLFVTHTATRNKMTASNVSIWKNRKLGVFNRNEWSANVEKWERKFYLECVERKQKCSKKFRKRAFNRKSTYIQNESNCTRNATKKWRFHLFIFFPCSIDKSQYKTRKRAKKKNDPKIDAPIKSINEHEIISFVVCLMPVSTVRISFPCKPEITNDRSQINEAEMNDAKEKKPT